MVLCRSIPNAFEFSRRLRHAADDAFRPDLPPGRWIGRADTALGLGGRVTTNTYPIRGSRSGLEVILDAPPAVSALYSLASKQMRDHLSACHCQAVKHTFGCLEQVLTDWLPLREFFPVEELMAAAFTHDTHDGLHPGIHDHLLIFPRAREAADWEKLLRSPEFSPYLPALNAVYHCQLDGLLVHALDLSTERREETFTITGMPRRLVQTLHSGTETHSLAESALHWIRRFADWVSHGRENHRDPQGLPARYERWEAQAHTFRFTQEQADALIHLPPSIGTPPGCSVLETICRGEYLPLDAAGRADLQASLHRAHSQAYFAGHPLSAPHMLQNLADLCQEKHLAPLPFTAAVQGFLALHQPLERSTPRLQHLEPGETSPENASPVARFLESGALAHAGFRLDARQTDALTQLIEAPGALKVLDGFGYDQATQILLVANAIWKQAPAGYTVLGVAAGREFSPEQATHTGIRNRISRDKFLFLGSEPVANEKTIVVVDDIASCKPHLLSRLIDRAQDAGATTVLVSYLLSDRSEPPLAAAHNRGGGKGRVLSPEGHPQHFPESRQEALTRLIQQWHWDGVCDPKAHVIFANTPDNLRDLNHLAQRQCRAAGRLGQEGVPLGASTFYANDRVIFTEDLPTQAVTASTTGSVQVAVPRADSLLVKTDEGLLKPVSLREFRGLTLGYALPLGAEVAASVYKTYILLDGPALDAELAAVQLACPGERTQIWVAPRPDPVLEPQQHLETTYPQQEWEPGKEFDLDLGLER